MKLNYDFVKREILGDYFLIPVGKATSVFDGIIAINEMSAFIFDKIPDASDKEKIAALITETYDVDYETALGDVKDFFEEMKKAGITAE